MNTATSIGTSNQLDYLFKKQLGLPDTVPISLSGTVSGELGAYSSIPNIFPRRIYGQYVPLTCPTDFGPIGNSSYLSNMIPNDTTIGMNVSNIYYSSNYPYIWKYEKLTINATPGNENSYYNSQFVNSIPTNYNSSYLPELWTNNLGTDIMTVSAKGAVILDSDSGVITFFYLPLVISGSAISSSAPPKVTFYRYVGLTGNPGIAGLQGGFV